MSSKSPHDDDEARGRRPDDICPISEEEKGTTTTKKSGAEGEDDLLQLASKVLNPLSSDVSADHRSAACRESPPSPEDLTLPLTHLTRGSLRSQAATGDDAHMVISSAALPDDHPDEGTSCVEDGDGSNGNNECDAARSKKNDVADVRSDECDAARSEKNVASSCGDAARSKKNYLTAAMSEKEENEEVLFTPRRGHLRSKREPPYMSRDSSMVVDVADEVLAAEYDRDSDQLEEAGREEGEEVGELKPLRGTSAQPLTQSLRGEKNTKPREDDPKPAWTLKSPKTNGSKVRSFDKPKPLKMVNMMMHRLRIGPSVMHASGGSSRSHGGHQSYDETELINRWKWDIVDCLEISHQCLRDAVPNLVSMWEELANILEKKQDQVSGVLRRTLEDVKKQRDPWVSSFEADRDSARKTALDIEDRLLYDQTHRWLAGRPKAPEILRLLEYLETLLDKVSRMSRQLDLVLKSLFQSMIHSTNEHNDQSSSAFKGPTTQTFRERSVQDNVKSTLVSLAAVMVMPVPGILETWAISTGYLWLGDSGAAGRHMVVEHPQDTDVNQVLGHFETLRVNDTLEAVKEWEEKDVNPGTLGSPSSQQPCTRTRSRASILGAALLHNASPRRVEVKLVAKCSMDQGDVRRALEAHPIASLGRKLANWGAADTPDAVVNPKEMKIIRLPHLLDVNWYHEATFKHVGGSTVGSCCLKPHGIFTLVATDCGVRIRTSEDDNSIRVVNSSLSQAKIAIYPEARSVFSKALCDSTLKVSESVTYNVEEKFKDTFMDLDVQLPNGTMTVDVRAGQTIWIDGIFDISG